MFEIHLNLEYRRVDILPKKFSFEFHSLGGLNQDLFLFMSQNR
jgi:hypothetical protein